MGEAVGSYVKLNKLASGYSWNIQVSVPGGTVEELQEAKRRVLQLNEELANELLPETEEPEELAF